MKGEAVTHGAISIVNAIPTGKGAALGIGLRIRAQVKLDASTREIHVTNIGQRSSDQALVKETVREVLQRREATEMGAAVIIDSEIPPSRGLKSSSAVSNAVALATFAALRADPDDGEVLRTAVDASFKARVTITGAYDDAAASYFGGFVATDNTAREILRRENAPGGFWTVILVPKIKRNKQDIDLHALKTYAPLSEEALRLAMKGDYWKAMTLNGLCCAAALGLPVSPITAALSSGAVAAGVSGTGPSLAAVCRGKDRDRLVEAWTPLGEKILEAPLNNQKAWSKSVT